MTGVPPPSGARSTSISPEAAQPPYLSSWGSNQIAGANIEGTHDFVVRGGSALQAYPEYCRVVVGEDGAVVGGHGEVAVGEVGVGEAGPGIVGMALAPNAAGRYNHPADDRAAQSYLRSAVLNTSRSVLRRRRTV